MAAPCIQTQDPLPTWFDDELGRLASRRSLDLHLFKPSDKISIPDGNSGQQEIDLKKYLTGWKLHALTLGYAPHSMHVSILRYLACSSLCASLLLSAIESTVVSTALTSITDDLHGFNEGSWIVNAYMLTYTGKWGGATNSPHLLIFPGFLIIYAKLSDIFGRKIMLLSALLLFTIFSSACGAAQTLLQLCV